MATGCRQIAKRGQNLLILNILVDMVLALIESRDPKQYIQRMKQRDPELGKGWVQIVRTLPIATSGGPKKLKTGED